MNLIFCVKLFGDESEEVAIPNLFYGKTLIELAQMGENKVLALPDEKEEEDDENDEEDGQGADAVPGTAAEANDVEDDDDDDSENDENGMVATLMHYFIIFCLKALLQVKFRFLFYSILVQAKTEGNEAIAASSSSEEPQPGTSSGIQNGNGTASNQNAEDEEANENLQYAWEALEMAKTIFMRLGESYEEYLAEAHCGLGEISMENQCCTEAITDYGKFIILHKQIIYAF